MAINVTSNFTDSTGSDATQSWFNTALLIRGQYAWVHTIPVMKKSLARRSGKTMLFRRFEALPHVTTALTESVNPAGQSKTITTLATTIAPYGSFIEDSDMVILTQPDPQTTENVALLGQQMGESFDEIYRNTMTSATNVVFANGTSTLTVTQTISRNALDKVHRLLVINKARPFTPMIMASQNIGTGPVMPSYWAVGHEYVMFDVRHVEGFRLASEYGDARGGIIAGELGADKNGVRFLSSPNGYSVAGASGVTSAGTDVQNTGGFVNVYYLTVFGQQAMGGINLADNNGGIIRKPLGSGGSTDPLDMKATVGWKKYDTRLILNQNFLAQIECAASL